MLKQEMESKLGFVISNEGYQVLNDMYISCDLTEERFIELIRAGAKAYKLSKNN